MLTLDCFALPKEAKALRISVEQVGTAFDRCVHFHKCGVTRRPPVK
jgi:hypothetical protein